MSAPVKREVRWADLHEEIEAEFAELTGSDRLTAGLEHRSALRRAAMRDYMREYRKRAHVRAYYRAHRQRADVRAVVRERKMAEWRAHRRQELSLRAPIACADPQCGAVFVPFFSHKRYCSRTCSNRAAHTRWKARGGRRAGRQR